MQRAAFQGIHDTYYDLLNPHVDLVGFHRAESGDLPSPHDQILRDFDIWYVWSGDGRVEIDREWVSFSTDDVLIMKPGQLYGREERVGATSEYSIYYVHFLPFGHQQHALDSRLAHQLPTILPSSIRRDLRERFRELLDLYRLRPEGYQVPAKACMLTILSSVLTTAHAEPEDQITPTASHGLRRAMEYIDEHLTDNVSLGEIAAHAGLSSSHLCYLFGRCLHRAPIEYLIDLRLSAAKRRMIEGSSVTEAADQSGFHSIHYFSRIFKQRHGLSPLQFIKLCKAWGHPRDS